MKGDTLASISLECPSYPPRNLLIRVTVFACAILLMLLLNLPSASALDNLLDNSDLANGSSMPDDWHPSRRADCGSFQWLHSGSGLGELKIVGAPGNDAAWAQDLKVSPGWYYLSGETRVEGVGKLGGVFLAVKQRKAFASTVRREGNWDRDGFYVRVWRGEPLEVQCGLASPTFRTSAFCRNITLSKVSGAPPVGALQFKFEKAPPSTINWTTVALILLLGSLGFIFYRFADREASLRTAVGPSTNVVDGLWPGAAVVLLFVSLLAAILAVTRTEWVPGVGLTSITPAAVRSDEPHYLLLINSLLFDHDFELQNDYERVAEGGMDAGARFQGVNLDHHTLLVNQRTGQHAFASIDSPNSVVPCDPEFTNSNEVYEVSAHPPGFSMLIALAIAPFRPSLSDVEGEAAVVLALISWFGALVTYVVGRRIGMGRTRAMLATLVLVIPSPARLGTVACCSLDRRAFGQ